MIDDDDRRLIDEALSGIHACTNPRRDLTDTLRDMDKDFVDSIMPL